MKLKLTPALKRKLHKDIAAEQECAREAVKDLRKDIGKKDRDPDPDMLRGFAADLNAALDRESALRNLLCDLQEGE